MFEEVNKECNCDGLSTEDFHYAISRSPDFTRYIYSHDYNNYYYTSSTFVAHSVLDYDGGKIHTHKLLLSPIILMFIFTSYDRFHL